MSKQIPTTIHTQPTWGAIGLANMSPWTAYVFSHSKFGKIPNVETTVGVPPIFAVGSLVNVPPTTATSRLISASGPRVAEPRTTATSPSTVPNTLAEPATTTRSPDTRPLIVAFPETTTTSAATSSSFRRKSFPTITTSLPSRQTCLLFSSSDSRADAGDSAGGSTATVSSFFSVESSCARSVTALTKPSTTSASPSIPDNIFCFISDVP